MEIKMRDFDAVEFFPYTSVVTGVIMQTQAMSKSEHDVLLQDAWEKAAEDAEKANIGYAFDNKIVIKLKHRYSDNYIFIGKKDGRIDLGLGVIRFP